MLQTFFRLLTELSSRKSISKVAGRFAQSELSRFFIARFAKTYNIVTHEAEKPLSEYRTLNEFFTRKLKAGLRPIDEAADSVISPVDGRITAMGQLVQGQLLNIKGQDYSLERLLNHSPRQMNFRNGFYFVLYLSPSDYHRIHAPVDGTIVERDYIKGSVYPVNDFGLTRMKNVLSRNERIVTYIHHAHTEVVLVKVGAMNVSSIQYEQPESNKLTKGQPLAFFQFGSTVVLLMEDERFQASPDLQLGAAVKMGEKLGTLQHKK